jgi:cytosine/adenosine deaminase-related metal-dependent hydrolase
MATVNGARALGLADRAGELVRGAWADLCAFETGVRGAAAELEALTSGAAGVRAVWVAGRRVAGSGAPADGPSPPPRAPRGRGKRR